MPQAQQQADTGIVAIGRAGRRAGGGPCIQVGRAGRVLAVDFRFLAQLVQDIGIVRPLGQLGVQQRGIAAALLFELGADVAVVAEHQRQPHAPQRRHRLFVDTALVAHAARQQARDPGVGPLRRAAGIVQALDADHAEQRAERACLAQFAGAAFQPLVGVHHQVPVGIGELQRGIPGGGKIIDPRETVDLRAAGLGHGDGLVGRAGVEHDHAVDMGLGAAQAAFDAACLVARDDDQRDLGPPAGLGLFAHGLQRRLLASMNSEIALKNHIPSIAQGVYFLIVFANV